MAANQLGVLSPDCLLPVLILSTLDLGADRPSALHWGKLLVGCAESPARLVWKSLLVSYMLLSCCHAVMVALYDAIATASCSEP